MENEELVTEGIDLLLSLAGQDMDDFTQQVIDASAEGGEAAAYKLIQEKVLTLEDDSKKEARRQKQEYEAAEKQRREQEAKKAAEAAERAIFTDEENLKLTQALKKFPGGTINRWEKISQYVGTRTPKEVMAGTKELQRRVSLGAASGTAIQAAAARQFGTQVPTAPTTASAAGEMSAAAKLGAAAAAGEISAAAKLGAAAAVGPQVVPWTEAEQTCASDPTENLCEDSDSASSVSRAELHFCLSFVPDTAHACARNNNSARGGAERIWQRFEG